MFFFTGEDNFLLSKELNRRKTGFFDKFGENSVSQYDKDNFDENKVLQDLNGSDLFASKKMIIFKGYPDDSEKSNKLSSNQITFLDNILDDIQEGENLIVFVSIKPDKRKKGYKKIDKICQKKSFGKLKKPQLTENITKRSDGILNKTLAGKLIDIVGNNTGNLWNETLKIKTVCEFYEKSPTEKLLQNIVYSNTVGDPFAMMDKIFFNPDKALNELNKLQKNGENRNLIMGTLLRGCRNSILYLDCANTGMESSSEIAKKLGIHPFVISKLKAKKNQLTAIQHQIENLFNSLIDIDYKLKVGIFPEQGFWLEVKKLIINFI